MLELPPMSELRAKVLRGELTTEEMAEALRLLRQGRVTAHSISARSRAKKAPVDISDLLNDLENL